MIFISFYTKNTPYKEVCESYFKPSVEKWGIKHNIYVVKDLLTWNKNTRYKAKIILEALNKYEEDVVFLDSDAEILKYPKLLFNIPKEYDIALHKLDWYLMWREQEGNPQRELLSGTMFIRYSEKNIKLVKQWIQKDEISKETKEQKNFEELVLNNPKYNIYNLPASYCAIIKRDNTVPEYVGEPIILHHQASRQHRYFKRDNLT